MTPRTTTLAALTASLSAAVSTALAATTDLDPTAFALDTPTLAALGAAPALQPDNTHNTDNTDHTNAQPGATSTNGTDADTKPTEYEPLRAAFARAGSDWLTFGGAWANDFAGDNDLNLHLAWSRFLADKLEFGVEAAAWYFAQEGDDTVGLSGSMFFRWHFLEGGRSTHLDPDWTVFAEVGIGMLFALDEVPDGGTDVDFLPRVGGGFTYRLDDAGDRLVAGLRWHHISNGRFDGNEQNPARDSILLFVGVQVPF